MSYIACTAKGVGSCPWTIKEDRVLLPVYGFWRGTTKTVLLKDISELIVFGQGDVREDKTGGIYTDRAHDFFFNSTDIKMRTKELPAHCYIRTTSGDEWRLFYDNFKNQEMNKSIRALYYKRFPEKVDASIDAYNKAASTFIAQKENLNLVEKQSHYSQALEPVTLSEQELYLKGYSTKNMWNSFIRIYAGVYEEALHIFLISGDMFNSFGNVHELKFNSVTTDTYMDGDFQRFDQLHFQSSIPFYNEKVIPLEEILFYYVKGDVKYETIISGGEIVGGGTSLKGALIGGLIAGDAGAIIGSRQSIQSTPIQAKTKTVEKKKLIIRTKGGDLSFAVELYDELLKLLPEKDAQYISLHQAATQAKQETEKDIPTEIRKYKELLDDGIITEEEFNAKKKQLLGI